MTRSWRVPRAEWGWWEARWWDWISCWAEMFSGLAGVTTFTMWRPWNFVGWAAGKFVKAASFKEPKHLQDAP